MLVLCQKREVCKKNYSSKITKTIAVLSAIRGERKEMKNLKEKLRYYKLMEVRKELVKKGRYQEGKKVLEFFREKRIVLGFSDTDNNLEEILEKIGFPSYTSNRSWSRTFYLK